MYEKSFATFLGIWRVLSTALIPAYDLSVRPYDPECEKKTENGSMQNQKITATTAMRHYP